MKPMVKNAASQEQVRDAEERGKSVRQKELNDVAFIISSPQGRRFMWRLLARCKVFGSVNDNSGSQVYYKVGQQDLGHFLLGEMGAANEDAFILMMNENKGELANV